MKQYVVDAFTDKVFAGNPAAVCVMDKWLSDELMMKITIENNLSETAFCVKEGKNYHLRWFTPGGEIDLCGHATLATAYVILRFVEPELTQVRFDTLSDELIVTKNGELLEMVFPAYDLKPVEVTDAMTEVIGARPTAAFMGRDLLCVVNSEDIVRSCAPDMAKVMQLDGLLLHVTARARILTAFRAALRRSATYRRIPCAARVTATSSPTGQRSLAKPSSPPIRPRAAAAFCTHGSTVTRSSSPVRPRCSAKRRSISTDFCDFNRLFRKEAIGFFIFSLDK